MSLAFFDLWLFYFIWAWMFVELPGIASPAQSRTSLNRDLTQNNMKHHETKSVLPKCFVCVDICSICLKVISFLKPRLRLSKFSGAWYFLSCLVMVGNLSVQHLSRCNFNAIKFQGPHRFDEDRSKIRSYSQLLPRKKIDEDIMMPCAPVIHVEIRWLCQFFPSIQTSAKKPHIGTSRSVVTGLLTFRTKNPAIHPCESRLAWSHWAWYWPRRLRLQGEGQHSAP